MKKSEVYANAIQDVASTSEDYSPEDLADIMAELGEHYRWAKSEETREEAAK